MTIRAEYTPNERKQNVFLFYFIIAAVLICFLIAEWVVNNYVLSEPLSYSQRILLSCTLYGIIFAGTLGYAQNTRTTYYEMGFHTSYIPKSLAIGFLATSGFLIAVAAFQMPLSYDPIISGTFPSVVDILILVGFTFVIGLSEESVFRGYIQTNYLKIESQSRSVLLTGILFAILHVPSYIISGNYFNVLQIPSLILVGLILGYIRIHSGNIWSVIIAHTTWNLYVFLFTANLNLDTMTDMELYAVLAASAGMWGTLLLSMFFAKTWIDRPDQIPMELRREYSAKIQKLMNKVWKLEGNLSRMRMIGYPYSRHISIYSNRIKTFNDSIEVLKEFVPQINEKNYKILRKLIPLKLKSVKLQNLMLLTNYPPRLSKLDWKINLLEADIQSLQSELQK